MSVSRDALFEFLDHHYIAHSTLSHAPIFTVEQGKEIKAALAGGHTKNLFLKDKSGALFLICALAETQIRLNKLHPVIGCKRLSFGKEDLLWEALGVRPGSVTLFALINDRKARVKLILDKALFADPLVNFHPLENTATTTIRSQHMLDFAKAVDHEPKIIDFSEIR